MTAEERADRLREREHIRALRGRIVVLANALDGAAGEALEEIVRWSIRELSDLADKP